MKSKLRRTPQRPPVEAAIDRALELHPDRVLTFLDWCKLNALSPATGRRLLASGDGPAVTRLSPRRIGISLGANAKWQASRSA